MSNFQNLFERFGNRNGLKTEGTLKALIQETGVKMILNEENGIVHEGNYSQFVALTDGKNKITIKLSDNAAKRFNDGTWGQKQLLEAPIYSGTSNKPGDGFGKEYLTVGVGSSIDGKAVSLAELMKLIETPATVA